MGMLCRKSKFSQDFGIAIYFKNLKNYPVEKSKCVQNMSNVSSYSSGRSAKKVKLNLDDTSDVCIEDVLNEDCISHIFTFLNLRELTRLERVCKRWRVVSQRCSSEKKFLHFKDIFPSTSLQLEKNHLVQMLSKFGHRLKSVHVTQPKPYPSFPKEPEELLELIGVYCVNLEHLILELYWCEREQEPHLSNLRRVLPQSDMRQELLPEEFLKILPNLKSLTIGGKLKAIHLDTILKEAKDLEKIVFISRLCEPTFLFNLTANCKHLELNTDSGKYNNNNNNNNNNNSLSDEMQWLRFANGVLPSLTNLEVFKSNYFNISSLLHLSPTYRVLDLTDAHCELLQCDVNKLLVRLPNLEILKLTGYPCKLNLSALQSSSNTLKELHLPGEVLTPDETGWPLFPNLGILNATCVTDNISIPRLTIEKMVYALLDRCPNLKSLDMRCSSCSHRGVRRPINLPKSKRPIVSRCLPKDDGCLRFLSDNRNAILPSIEFGVIPFSEDELKWLIGCRANLKEVEHKKRVAVINEVLQFISQSRPGYIRYISRRYKINKDDTGDYKTSIDTCKTLGRVLLDTVEQIKLHKEFIANIYGERI